LSRYGLFGAHDKEIGYDNIILSLFNLLFGASIEKDKLNESIFAPFRFPQVTPFQVIDV